MSLRDQLLAKGLVNKKDARRVERELKEERRQAQATRRPAAEVEAERRAAQQAAEESERRRKIEERRRREAERAEREQHERVRQLIRGNQVRSRGLVRFFHRTQHPTRLGRILVSEHVAWKLRCGECAIVARSEPGRETDYVVVSARAAQRLEEIAPGIVVCWVRDTRGLSDPDQGLWKPEWEISLKPHRAVVR